MMCFKPIASNATQLCMMRCSLTNLFEEWKRMQCNYLTSLPFYSVSLMTVNEWSNDNMVILLHCYKCNIRSRSVFMTLTFKLRIIKFPLTKQEWMTTQVQSKRFKSLSKVQRTINHHAAVLKWRTRTFCMHF